MVAVEDWHWTVVGVAENKGIHVDNLRHFDPRSTVAHYKLWEHQNSAPAQVQTWSTTCLAPLDLLRYTAQQLQHGDSDEMALLLSIASGWVAAKVNDSYQKNIQIETFLNDVDILSNIVMALGNSESLPAVFVDNAPQTLEAKQHSEIDINRFSLRISQPIFREWLLSFTAQTFRDLHLFAQRENDQFRRRVNTSSMSQEGFDALLRDQTVSISDDPQLEGFIHREMFREIAEQFSPNQLEVLYRRERGQKDGQIASEMGIKISTVQTHFKRGKEKAKEIISHYK